MPSIWEGPCRADGEYEIKELAMDGDALNDKVQEFAEKMYIMKLLETQMDVWIIIRHGMD